MKLPLAACLLASLLGLAVGNLIVNGGFESPLTDKWECSRCHMQVTSSDTHSGSHSVIITNRFKYFDGLAQAIHVTPGQYYHVSAWVKFLNDHPKQNIGIHMEFAFPDGKHEYPSAALHNLAVSSDGWFHLVGGFTAPDTAPQKSRLYFQSGPSEQVNYVVDDVSVVPQTNQNVTRAYLDQMIDKQRKSNINVQVHTASGINLADVQIHVLQKKKLFPFGTAVRGSKYNYNAAGGRYGDFIHKHFNWAVPENSLKWPAIEPTRGKKNFQRPLDMIHRLKSQGLKVRGHNLVWSVPKYVQGWVKQLNGSELRRVVQDHIQEVMNVTHGLLEHWDVNNENLHGQWYQDHLSDPNYDLELFRIAHHNDPTVKLFLNDYSVVASGWSTNWYQDHLSDPSYDLELFRIAHHNDPTVKLFLNDYSVVASGWSTNWYQDHLSDPSYDLELFRIAHHNDPTVKLFLNDYSVVASGWSTNDYLIQAEKVKAAGVGLNGMGVQCHFHDDIFPDPTAIKSRLDKLSEAGLPIWATELDVGSADENTRADYYEAVLRTLYAHPAVEGILLWGFWDQAHWRGDKAALVKGANLELTAAGRRVLDLLENQWMTDETHVLSPSRDHISVRGFHGDYELRVIYKGRELGSLKKTFTLAKADHSVSITVQT